MTLRVAGQLASGYDDADLDRLVPESAKNPNRTPFERDRARILHSSALRRLSDKTQVLGPESNDFIRNRLTHTLEVAQVGRELGKALGCDPDVVDAACLAHDLGHPPFGHNGERALAEIAHDIGGFEGNAQTLRLLTRLEAKVFSSTGVPAGLNLTRASLDASVKYPWSFAERPVKDGQRTHKFGVYQDDVPVFEWLRQGAPEGRQCLEAQVMDLADDISYSVHDVEDAIAGGTLDLAMLHADDEQTRVIDYTTDWYGHLVSADDLRAAIARLRAAKLLVTDFDGSRRALAVLKDATSQLIGRFAQAAQHATRQEYGDGPLTRYNANLIVPQETLAEILVLKGLAVAYVMAPRETQRTYIDQRVVIEDLVKALSYHGAEALEPAFRGDWHVARDEGARLRVVIDQVASLTDVSALRWHQRWCLNGETLFL
ncbi:deoxyguanosinetriphosphate triphosphohydrolase [Jonesia denitrificans]|uniref:Deoxyguanosinetriphosphate triphosphohydrolase-like protein n=1 Tax=Jonesia denitrificans (strain ATCC 14870 / DSM 20603 / BCRC 15368 / CIP 55.134 / JCM 11481 / NBRC 15587 / NCTC 10816 / Prevot 55134) TaxID=471856 RepID=C7R501_JONDD|nr:deoxyguanosinetriphosphate triphosphohydrolase [Jonesia denitrificans]ACV09171.1 deoxyguanosinetriphosphate triphosphohydrolase [Jonesia denitrificans DSM 20603]QXB44096.1 deoxyguanosinetriphosphate triphosphohydrolase [Jonesia denitrificans]SQH21399.1 Deoxyguanosinetriphosphate triphosphohydrolase [Jonesia denitrificans]